MTLEMLQDLKDGLISRYIGVWDKPKHYYDNLELLNTEINSKKIEKLKTIIKSFSKLEKNWDSYDANEITPQSIMTAYDVLDSINDVNDVKVFPMRNGGIQFEIGHYREIEILDFDINEIGFDSEFNKISIDFVKRFPNFKLTKKYNKI